MDAPLPDFLWDLLHRDPELHSVLRLGCARPYQLNEEVSSEHTELGAAQLVQGIPAQERLESMSHTQQGPEATRQAYVSPHFCRTRAGRGQGTEGSCLFLLHGLPSITLGSRDQSYRQLAERAKEQLEKQKPIFRA
jgi:hypothetical protein